MVECMNCGKHLSGDLRIEASKSGFAVVALGVKCNVCGTLYVPDSFLSDTVPVGAGIGE